MWYQEITVSFMDILAGNALPKCNCEKTSDKLQIRYFVQKKKKGMIFFKTSLS